MFRRKVGLASRNQLGRVLDADGLTWVHRLDLPDVRRARRAPGLEEVDVSLDGLDDVVEVAVERLLGEAQREPLGLAK